MMEQTDFSVGTNNDWYKKEYEKKIQGMRVLINIMFILSIVQQIFSLQENEYIGILSSEMMEVGNYLIIITEVLIIVLFYKLAKYNEKFKIAGVSRIFSSVSSVLILFGMAAESPFAAFIFAVLMFMFSEASVFFEMQGYADILIGIDNKLSDEWEKLWKITITVNISSFLGIYMAGQYILLDIIVVLLMVGNLIMIVMRIIKLNKTCKALAKHSFDN